MATPHFNLPAELFADVFPFHLVFNQDTELVQSGTVLQRIYPELSMGNQLGKYFRVNRPSIQVDFNAIRAQSHCLFLLESLHNAMKLKGQMMYVEQSEVMVFLGSPWITDLTELNQLGLKLNDFAIHEPMVDFLFLLQAQNTALADAKKLTEKLTSQQAEIRQALEKEKELSSLKSRFVTMASHEFRTPLTTILSSAELLEKYANKLVQEKKLQHLHRIQASVKHMTELLNNVLLIGKAEAGKLQFTPVPLDLAQFCRDLVEELQLGTGSNHTIAFASLGECSTACMDEKLLRHILSNLLSNAIKYSPAGGTVNFELICNQGEAIFLVQDQGIGIPAADQAQLFNSFHRASNVGTISGTGLGLAIVKKSVDSHGGKITVKSEIGVGTTFTVTLPLEHVCRSYHLRQPPDH